MSESMTAEVHAGGAKQLAVGPRPMVMLFIAEQRVARLTLPNRRLDPGGIPAVRSDRTPRSDVR